MDIRAATIEDMPPLLELIRAYWEFEEIDGFEPERVGSLLHRLLREPRLGAIWVAESQSTLVGYLVAVYVLSLEYGGLMAEIDEFFVMPEARSHGVGARLLAAAEAALAAQACVRLQLQLGINNHGARGFYRRHGYAERAGYQLLDKPLALTTETRNPPAGH